MNPAWSLRVMNMHAPAGGEMGEEVGPRAGLEGRAERRE